jgi:hypothetical protein
MTIPVLAERIYNAVIPLIFGNYCSNEPNYYCSFVKCPHAQEAHGFNLGEHLVNQSMLSIDAA